MRIVTMCTLAFAICGEREGKISKTVQPKTLTNRRLLAKGLLLGASGHAVSGFVQPSHPAKALGQPAGVRPLEPLKGWGIDTINKGKHSPLQMKEEDEMEEALVAEEILEDEIEEALVAEEILKDEIEEALEHSHSEEALAEERTLGWESWLFKFGKALEEDWKEREFYSAKFWKKIWADSKF